MALLRRMVMGLVLSAAGNAPAVAGTPGVSNADDAVARAYAQGTAGPAAIPLRGLATLALPPGFVFVPAGAGQRLMHGMSRPADGQLLGLVVPATYANWFIAVQARETGHVAAAAVATLDGEEIRGTLAAATRRDNAARRQSGFSPLDAGAFLEPPTLDAAHGRFTTAIRVFEAGPSTGGNADQVDVDTLIFGRTQTLQISLVDDLPDLATHRVAFNKIVAGTSFAPGQRALDFVAGRDAVATQLLDVLFGGRTAADIAKQAADDVAEAKRIAALPPPKSYASEIKLAFFGVLGLLSLLMLVMAFSPRARDDDEPQRSGGIDRVLRAGTKR